MSIGPFSPWERSVAARYLRAKRKEGGVALISVISFVGISLAVAVLIIVMSVMNGFRIELLSRILGFEGHAFVMGTEILNDGERDQTVARLRAVPDVIEALPIIESYALASGAAQLPVRVRGVDPSDVRANPLIAGNIVGGSLAGFGQGEYGGDLVLVGDRMAQNLGLNPGDPFTLVTAGGTVTAFGGTPYQSKVYVVGGLFRTGMAEYDGQVVLMPLAQAQPFFGREGFVDAIEIKLRDPDSALTMRETLREAAGGGETKVEAWTDRRAAFFSALQIEHFVMRLILGLLVVIAAMNIISGLVMLVKNKGRDIAILRTMGASPSSVMRIFVMTGAAIGVSGTLAGVALGSLFSVFIREIQQFLEWVTGRALFSAEVYYLSYIPATVDWVEVGFIALFSCGMAVLCTLPPAHRASKLDPVEALRYE